MEALTGFVGVILGIIASLFIYGHQVRETSRKELVSVYGQYFRKSREYLELAIDSCNLSKAEKFESMPLREIKEDIRTLLWQIKLTERNGNVLSKIRLDFVRVGDVPIFACGGPEHIAARKLIEIARKENLGLMHEIIDSRHLSPSRGFFSDIWKRFVAWDKGENRQDKGGDLMTEREA